MDESGKIVLRTEPDMQAIEAYYGSVKAMMQSVLTTKTKPAAATNQPQESSITDNQGNTITAVLEETEAKVDLTPEQIADQLQKEIEKIDKRLRISQQTKERNLKLSTTRKNDMIKERRSYNKRLEELGFSPIKLELPDYQEIR